MCMHVIRHSAGLTLWAATLAWLPMHVVRAQATPHSKGASLEESVDASIRPGNDFFAYANGAWLRAAQIPTGKERWGAREEAAALTRRRVAQLLDDAGSAAPKTLARRVADFRAAYANDSAIETKGMGALAGTFRRIDEVRDQKALARLLGREMRADVDPLTWGVYRSASVLGFAVQHSIHGEKTYAPFLLQGGLGLGDRTRYLATDTAALALRAKYLGYIARQLSQAGFDNPPQRAAAVLALETAIAQTQASSEASANDRNADSVWTRADFARRAPGMDWAAFLDAAGLGKEPSIIAWQPSAVTGLASLVASQSLETWKDYLRFQAIDTRADVLPRAFAEAALAMHGVTTSRAQRATDATNTALSDAVGRMYADRYFPAAQKARVQAIVARVKAAFAKRVATATWMSPATTTQALTKVRTLYIGVGYPDHWPSEDDLVVNATDAFGNMERVLARDRARALSHLRKAFDATEWLMPAQLPGAILVFQQNTYDFSAALLQPPKFDPAASDAATFGAVGAIIGHDITHYIDVLGADYDTTGRMKHWWTPEDSTHFQSLAEPLVKQFSAYRPFPDASVNGVATRTENVADLGGLVAAFDAYRATLGANVGKTQVRKSDREFFIAFAQSWRSKWTDAALHAYVVNGDHAPDPYRIATVRNMDAWYDAFDVRPGDALYLDPAARVRIW